MKVDGAAIPDAAWRLRKSRTLLKVLALTPGRALHPERLEAMLWPDRDPAAAGNNLRQATYHARRALSGAGADGATVLASRGDLLALAADIEVDVDAFSAAAARAEASGSTADIEAALGVYCGELLPEDPYEDWASDPRRVLADRHVALLLALAATREPSAATDPLHRAILADPLNEEAQRALMRAYASSGRRTQALAQYEVLRQTLRRDLAADPEAETRALYRELLAEGAPQAAPAEPPPDARPAARHNLPWQPTSFIGRRRELGELERVLDARRLVTLTGPGGCGKTRLALELARRRLDRHPDGAWVVELAAIADSGLVGQTTAAALGLDLRPDEAPELGVASRLADRELLLVLDNCEHVLGACVRLVETVLARCPGVAILATSREPFHLPGEVDWRVPSMSMLDTEELSDIAELAAADAVELFCDRARSAHPPFKLSVANAQAVAEICMRVDGLPLAIELAAARTTALSPAEIARRLGDGLAVLRASRAGGLTRQQTLEGTLDWSHDLLDDAERTLFRRLSVFAGGFELEAAEEIAADGELSRDDVLELLAGLVDKSLVGADDAGDSYRYRLLEPVRQYAEARLRVSGEFDARVEAHARWFAALTDHPGGRVTDLEPAWVDRLDTDHDNLRAAMSWLLEHDPARALEVAAGMAGLWLLRAHLREGCRWLDTALARAPERTLARADAMHARQALERRRPDNYDLADELGLGRIAIHRELDDPRGLSIAMLDLADGEALRGRFPEMIARVEEARELLDGVDDVGMQAAIAERIGLAAAWRVEFDEAREAFELAFGLCDGAPEDAQPASAVVSLSGFLPAASPPPAYPVMRLEESSLHFRRLAPRAARVSLLSHLAYVARCTGRYDDARTQLDSALDLVRENGNPLDAARLVAQRGMLETRAGDLDAAEPWLEQSLVIRQRLREHRGILLTHAALAVVAGLKGEPERSQASMTRAWRMAEQVLDGPGMGGVLLARAELYRGTGQLDAAREALNTALTVFYGITGLMGYASWLHLQHAYLSLELGDDDEVTRRLDIAWNGFSASETRSGLEHCRAVGERLRAANGLLTGAGWSPPDHQLKEDE